MLNMCAHTQFRNTKVEKIFEKSKKSTAMNSGKKSYADILKGTYAGLNPKLDAQKLVKKYQRVRLSESAKSNLRAAINGEAMVKSDKATNPVVSVYDPVKTLMEMTRPLVLASASAGILPSFVMDDRQFMQSSVNSAGVHLLKPNEIGAIEGKVWRKIQSMYVMNQMRNKL